MSEPDPTVRAQELGTELRKLREAAGLTLDQASGWINSSPSQLSRVENGRLGIRTEDVAALLATYRLTGPRRTELLNLARESDRRGWWQRPNSPFRQRLHTLQLLEASASTITNFETVVVPGLLQTGEYTQALMVESGIVPEDQIEDRMVTRLERHAVLRRQYPPTLVAILDEPVLHRPVGGRDVLRRQLEYLVEVSIHSNITIRVVPCRVGGHAGTNGSFTVLRRPQGPPVIYVENLAASLFMEDPTEIRMYTEVTQSLLLVALDEQESVEMIASLARDLDPEASAE